MGEDVFGPPPDRVEYRALDSLLESRRRLVRAYNERFKAAEALAAAIASRTVRGAGVVGRVALTEDIGGDEIPVDVPPETWVELAHNNPAMLGEGYYYVIVDPKTMGLILASVSSTTKPSVAKSLASNQPVVTVPLQHPHPAAIAGNVVSLRVWLRPLIAVYMGEKALTTSNPSLGDVRKLIAGLEPSTPSVPPEPNSPVVVPAPEILEALLAPGKGEVLVGGLAVMDSVYVAGARAVPVRLGWDVLVKHVLVTGTTGSGKTSLVKNMMLSAVARSDGVHVVVLDANSDYVAGLLPGYIPAGKVTWQAALVLRLYGVAAQPGRPVLHEGLRGLVVIPCTKCRDYSDYRGRAESYGEYLEAMLGRSYSKQGCRLSVEGFEDAGGNVYKFYGGVSCGGDSRGFEVFIAPRKIVVSRVSELARVDPYMTPRAREALRVVEGQCRAYTVESVLAVLRGDRECDAVRGLHRETLRNLETRLAILGELGIIEYTGPSTRAIDIDYGSLAETMNKHGLNVLVLDLGYAAREAPGSVDPQTVKVLLGYKLLVSLADRMERRDKPKYAMVVVDEAHLFFPRREGGYADVLRSSIERLARLGRSRGIAVVFSTHRESDVSPIISTLANTKIYLRTDKKTAEELPLPSEYKRRLPFYRDHAGVLASYAVRGGYIGVVNAPPLIGHRTV